ncbi:MAG: GNAT family N-acetyltransferase [Nibricoccus sp.]
MLTTRTASFRDIPALVGMMRDFYAESNCLLDTNRAENAFTTLLSNRDTGRVIIASDGAAAGYVVLTLRYNIETGVFDGYVDDLYVVPKLRRRRIASELLAHLFREAVQQRLSAVHVEADLKNIAAIALYERHGMENAHLGVLTRQLGKA